LGLFFGIPAYAAPYPTAEQLRNAIAETTAQLKSERLEVESLDAQADGVTRPLMASGFSLGDGVCVVYYNAKPEDGLVQFFDSVPAADLSIWLNSVAVHEITHCIEKREAYVHRRFDKVLPAGYSRDNMTIQGYSSVVRSGAVEIWGEALADIASVLYFQQAVPERWEQFANGLAAMRRNLAGKWPEHDTSVWLRKVVAARPQNPANQSLFETAFQLRRQFSTASDVPAIPAPRAEAGEH
jgi:hypothetical protein